MMRTIHLDYSRYVQPPIASLIFAKYGKNLQTLKFAKKMAKTRTKIQAAYLCMSSQESSMKPLKPLVSLFLVCFGIKELCQFWHFQKLPNSAICNCATHFGISSDSFYTLIFAILGKDVHYFMLLYQLTVHSGIGFSLYLPNLAKLHH